MTDQSSRRKSFRDRKVFSFVCKKVKIFEKTRWNVVNNGKDQISSDLMDDDY